MEVHLANQSRDRMNGLTTGPKVRCSSFAPRWCSTSKKSNLQFIERHVGQRIVIRAATMMWTARRERGREGACGDWAGAAFWTEFARRGSLAAIAVCLNTRGAWSGEGKTVSQADVCCTHTCKPLDMWIRRFTRACRPIPRVVVSLLKALTTSAAPGTLLGSVWNWLCKRVDADLIRDCENPGH